MSISSPSVDLYEHKDVSMQISDFVPEPNFVFKHPTQVASRLGSFCVELKPDEGEPDEQMLQLAEELMADFESAKTALEESVYEEYREASHNHDWMIHCRVPTGLAMEQLAPFILERVLIVYRYQLRSKQHGPGWEYLRQVYVRPKWDDAQSLFFEYHDGRWHRLDF